MLRPEVHRVVLDLGHLNTEKQISHREHRDHRGNPCKGLV
jgi:hypothetical protein